jgi:hypothetical protein
MGRMQIIQRRESLVLYKSLIIIQYSLLQGNRSLAHFNAYTYMDNASLLEYLFLKRTTKSKHFQIMYFSQYRQWWT